MAHIIVTGAAGFIGSHLVDKLLAEGHQVTGIDNFVRGTEANVATALDSPRFALLRADLADRVACDGAFTTACQSSAAQMVWHLAANSDIAAGAENPRLDLRDTFLTTFEVLEAMRTRRIPSIAFASSSAIYGEHADTLAEDTGPLLPISNYGAMKLASEAAISAAVESHLEKAFIFRFPNVVGARATHGIIYDLLNKLRRTPAELVVLGDGTQQKPYLHVTDLLSAMWRITQGAEGKCAVFNIAEPGEGVTVRFIAEAVRAAASPPARIVYTGGSRGWVGDVPKFRYATAKLHALGWRPELDSEAAILRAIEEIHRERSGQ